MLKIDNYEYIVYAVLAILILFSNNENLSPLYSGMENVVFRGAFLFVITYTATKNVKLSIALSFIYMLFNVRANRSESFQAASPGTAGSDPLSQNKVKTYCVPAGKGGCNSPYVESSNDKSWCCIGDGCVCNQPCPPTQCVPVIEDSGECPYVGMTVSPDNDKMCSYDGKSCKQDRGCPAITTCGGTTPPDRLPPPPKKPDCPCNPKLVCTKKADATEMKLKSDAELKKDCGCGKPSYTPPKPDNTDPLTNITGTIDYSKDFNPINPFLKYREQNLHKRHYPFGSEGNLDKFIM